MARARPSEPKAPLNCRCCSSLLLSLSVPGPKAIIATVMIVIFVNLLVVGALFSPHLSEKYLSTTCCWLREVLNSFEVLKALARNLSLPPSHLHPNSNLKPRSL